MNRKLSRGVTLSLALISILSCSENGITGSDGISTDDIDADANRVATVTVMLASSAIGVGDTTRATATLLDYHNRPLTRIVTWSTNNASVANVDSTGLVTGVAAGTAEITATRGLKSGSATITVTGIGATGTGSVASVAVSLAATSLSPGQTTQATATTYDSANNVLTGRTISWASSNISVATVSAAGLVTAVAPGTSQITATSEGKSGSAAIAVTTAQITNPGRVTDLKVIAIDSTGVTLSFTQVDDGTGQPANYDVRYAPPPIAWGSATSTTTGTCAVPIVGTVIGSPLSCKVLGLTPSTAYDFQLIAFRGTLNFNAVFGLLSNVVSATTNASASPPPPGSVEPAGMTPITERPFSALNEAGWTDQASPYLTIVSDATAPKSPPGVIQMLFPAGFLDGSSPAVSEAVLGTRYRTIYVSFWMKYSSNWVGHDTGTNKILHFWVGGVNRIYNLVQGVGTGPLVASVDVQGVITGGQYDGGTNGKFAPNLGVPGIIPRGQWVHWEMVFTGNTAGNADGTIEWWLDGAKLGSYGGVQFVSGNALWESMEWSPTWGGNSGIRVPADQYSWLDHIYISGKN